MDKKLDKKQKLALLAQWQKTHEQLEKAFNDLNKVVGCATDSPLGDAVFTGFDAYTDALSQLLGDDFEFLPWYCFDNSMGKKGMMAKAANWKKKRKITTLAHLLALVES